MPFQMCCGMIGIASPGSNAWGFLNVTTTVEGSEDLTSVISASHCAYWEFPWLWTSWNVKTTSSAEKGFPSCHFTPWRSL